MNMPLLGCIADDFTGGTDLSSTLVEGGLRTIQYLGIPQQIDVSGVDAMVIALKTRTCPRSQAIEESLSALRFLKQSGCRQFFFKYCSTFDSTPQGNIGPVADALMKELGTSFSIVCPAFPTNGRTVYKGHLFVDDVLISESSMKDHPLTPMTDANLVRFMGQQTKNSVCLVDHQCLQKGFSNLHHQFSQLQNSFEGYAVVDAISDDDLHLIGKAASALKLITGGSGVAIGLPNNFKEMGLIDDAIPSTDLPKVDGPSIILAGSCSAATNRQVEEWLRQGPGLKLNPVDIADGIQSAKDVITWAEHYLKKNQSVLVYTSDSPDSIKSIQEKLGAEQAGRLVEDTFSRIAISFFEMGIRSFILAGGETSGAVVKALNVSALRLGEVIDPGVPWTVSLSKPHIALALKSGNFGSDDFFIKTADGIK